MKASRRPWMNEARRTYGAICGNLRGLCPPAFGVSTSAVVRLVGGENPMADFEGGLRLRVACRSMVHTDSRTSPRQDRPYVELPLISALWSSR